MTSSARQDLLAWAENEMARLRRTRLVAEGTIKRIRDDLGGSHTVVTYPPLDALRPIDFRPLFESVRPVAELSLYMHIAFCEFICPFCHYETEYARLGKQEDERMRGYLDALELEISCWKQALAGSRLDSLYIGGGTPTAITTERLLRLLDAVSDLPRGSNFTACMETSPLTVVANDGREKLTALIDAGINRLSIGVQTFTPKLLTRSRGHNQEVARTAVETVLGLLDNVNIDLIQDLPQQEIEHILDDLEIVASYRPAQVTWYILRLREEAGWFKAYRRSALRLANSTESLRRRLLINEGMRRIGYRAGVGGRFLREDRFCDRFKKVRARLDTTLLGLGVSSYSHGWGHMFRNVFSRGELDGLREYVARINRDGYAVEMGCKIDEVEQVASRLVAGIRSGVALPEPTPATVSYLTSAIAQMRQLEEAGLVTVNERHEVVLTEVGHLFEEEICALFYSPAVQQRLLINRALAETINSNTHKNAARH